MYIDGKGGFQHREHQRVKKDEIQKKKEQKGNRVNWPADGADRRGRVIGEVGAFLERVVYSVVVSA